MLVSLEHVTKAKGKYLERIFQFLRQSFYVICLGSMTVGGPNSRSQSPDISIDRLLICIYKIIISSLQFSSSGTRDKEKEQKITVCTSELKDIKDMTSDAIHAVKAGKKNNTEDPVSMKLVLKELQLALTFLSSASAD